MSAPDTNSTDYYVNHLRALAVDCVQAANSGHPGMPLGMAPCAYTLFTSFLKFDALYPTWFDRDRFVLSNGHGCTLLYALLHMCGYKQLTIEQLAKFRQLGSCTPGHPELGVTDGVEVTTGPLGQGLANAVGMAIAEAHLAARLNIEGEAKLIDHHTFVFCGDGCLMEGIGQEALSTAGHLGLEKLIVIYDDNKISIDGPTSLAFTERTLEKYTALGFDVYTIANGDSDYERIGEVLAAAKASRNGKPKFVILNTTIGYGSQCAGSASAHGAPLGVEGVKALKAKFGITTGPFAVPEDAYIPYLRASARGGEQREQWNALLERYTSLFAQNDLPEAKHFQFVFAAESGVFDPQGMPKMTEALCKAMATRKASEMALEQLFDAIPCLIGGSADLSCSNLTIVADQKKCSFQRSTPHGRYIHYGVREHAMAGVANGIVAHGGLIPYCGTFLNFLGYCLGAVRLSALSHLGVIYVATHDSIGLGEDGPTHQPTEIAAVLRAMPNLLLFRPADVRETMECWKIALAHRRTPSVLCLSRQSLPCIPSSVSDAAVSEGVARGGYTLHSAGAGAPALVLLSTGSEVHMCIETVEKLTEENPSLAIRVVSMPCIDLFKKQPDEYMSAVLPEGVPVLAVEAWTSQSWGEFAHAAVCVDSFGCSASQKDCYKALGITVEKIVEKAKTVMAHYQGRSAPRRKLL